MAILRTTSVQPLGKVTKPNKYGQYPLGAFETFSNVHLRRPGIIAPMPALRDYRATPFGGANTVRRLFSGAASILGLAENAGTWAARWITAGASATIAITPAGMSAATFGVAKAHAAVQRGRWILTAENTGPLTIDAEGGTTSRATGFRALNFWFDSIVANDLITIFDARAFPANTPSGDMHSASYKIVWRRIQTDKYDTRGEPSYAITAEQTGLSDAIDPVFVVPFPTSAGVLAGDLIELYRTKFVVAGNEPGDTFLLAQAYTVTSGDVAAGFATIRDRATEAELGEELYTNPGIASTTPNASPLRPNVPPGRASDVAPYKDCLLYAIDRFQSLRKFKIPTWGDLTDQGLRTTGIGRRGFSGGTVVGGNATVTAVTPDTLGVVAGQLLEGTALFPANTTVVSKTATTITFSAVASGAGSLAGADVIDVMELNGLLLPITAQPQFFIEGISATYRGLQSASQDAVLISDRPLNVQFAFIGGVGASSAQSGTTMALRQGRYGDGQLTIRATNGANYAPPLPELASAVELGTYDERFNRIQAAKIQEPEALPPPDFQYVGNGTIYRLASTTDCVWAFCSDGLFRISGDGFPYRVDPVDPECILTGRNALSVMDNRVYAYTSKGLVEVSDAGVRELQTKVLEDGVGLRAARIYADRWDLSVECDHLHREAWLVAPSSTTLVYDVHGGFWYDTNALQRESMCWAPYLLSLVTDDGAANPDLVYFEEDGSFNTAPTVSMALQPYAGRTPLTAKLWSKVELLFEGTVNAVTMTSSFACDTSGGAPGPSVVIPLMNFREIRVPVSVPRNAARCNRMQPSFQFSAGATTTPWTIRAIAYVYTEEEERGLRA